MHMCSIASDPWHRRYELSGYDATPVKTAFSDVTCYITHFYTDCHAHVYGDVSLEFLDLMNHRA